jgi:hypothetical protein
MFECGDCYFHAPHYFPFIKLGYSPWIRVNDLDPFGFGFHGAPEFVSLRVSPRFATFAVEIGYTFQQTTVWERVTTAVFAFQLVTGAKFAVVFPFGCQQLFPLRNSVVQVFAEVFGRIPAFSVCPDLVHISCGWTFEPAIALVAGKIECFLCCCFVH